VATTSTPTSTSATVLRFNPTQRAVHWIHGIAFVVALVSGLSLFFAPLEALIAHRFVLRWVHIVSGLVFALAPYLVARLGDWRSVKSDFAEAQWWDADDRSFFSGWLVHDEAPVGRFNAGQKANMMFTLAATIFFLLSGVVMWQYLHFDADLVKNAGLVHDSLTFAILVVWLGHLWYALGNPKTRHSMRGMLDGRVERAWAARLHSKWLESVDANQPG
jgi:formate dehydrogenase subunit gamma